MDLSIKSLGNDKSINLSTDIDVFRDDSSYNQQLKYGHRRPESPMERVPKEKDTLPNMTLGE